MDQEPVLYPAINGGAIHEKDISVLPAYIVVDRLVGCGKKAHIVFPFAASDVTKIEVIYKDGESDAQKKTVNEETEIDSLYKSFSELSVQEKDCTSADTLGSVVFTFYLADETSYEINYLSFATKSGRLQSENAGFDYFTSGDLVGLWENLSGESKVVSP